MSTRVTSLDRIIAQNVKRLREEAGVTQPHVAGYLGITYQSYQKLEGGRVAFRAAVIAALCRLYNVRPNDLFGDVRGSAPPLVVKMVLLLTGMSEEEQQQVMEAALEIKHKEL